MGTDHPFNPNVSLLDSSSEEAAVDLNSKISSRDTSEGVDIAAGVLPFSHADFVYTPVLAQAAIQNAQSGKGDASSSPQKNARNNNYRRPPAYLVDTRGGFSDSGSVSTSTYGISSKPTINQAARRPVYPPNNRGGNLNPNSNQTNNTNNLQYGMQQNFQQQQRAYMEMSGDMVGHIPLSPGNPNNQYLQPVYQYLQHPNQFGYAHPQYNAGPGYEGSGGGTSPIPSYIMAPMSPIHAGGGGHLPMHMHHSMPGPLQIPLAASPHGRHPYYMQPNNNNNNSSNFNLRNPNIGGSNNNSTHSNNMDSEDFAAFPADDVWFPSSFTEQSVNLI